MNESLNVRGVITITKVDAATKEVLYSFSENNIVTRGGLGKLITNITEPSVSPLDRFVLGNDVGTGTLATPESAVDTYTAATQSELFEVPSSDIIITRPSNNIMSADATISGGELFNTSFPSEVTLNITSGTFRFADNTVFSYKRFPAISISRMVDINVKWEIQFLNSLT